MVHVTPYLANNESQLVLLVLDAMANSRAYSSLVEWRRTVIMMIYDNTPIFSISHRLLSINTVDQTYSDMVIRCTRPDQRIGVSVVLGDERERRGYREATA